MLALLRRSIAAPLNLVEIEWEAYAAGATALELAQPNSIPFNTSSNSYNETQCGLPRTPIIMVSANAMTEHLQQAIAAGIPNLLVLLHLLRLS